MMKSIQSMQNARQTCWAKFFTLLASIIIFSEAVGTQSPWQACPSGIRPHKKTCVCKRPENVGLAHKKVIEYYENGCFDKELADVVTKAKRQFAQPAQHDNDAVIFDIDETVVSDYCNVKSIKFGFVPKLSHEWVMKSAAPAIPAMKDFYHYLLKKGYHIIFLTGRHHNEFEATEKNLKNQGFTGYDKLIVRSAANKNLTAQEYKSRERAKLVKEGYNIVGSVGDQWSDITGDNVGQNPVKVPNYMYHID